MSESRPPEALPQHILDLLTHASLSDLRGPATEAEAQKGTTGPATALVTGPARFLLSALADDRLNKVGTQAGLTEKQVTRLSAEFIGDSKVLLLRAVEGGNRTVFEVRRPRNESGCRFNLFKLLGPARMTVASGWRERYDVFSVPQGNKFWPGLLIDLGHPKERSKAPVPKKRTRKKKQPAPPPGTSTDNQSQTSTETR
ncbi:MAG: hypothetical protein K0R39_3662 [Symbiobacteriaceae bacterium]|nr:hypothetical protein [Symbiobacteriaceae bacterium]